MVVPAEIEGGALSRSAFDPVDGRELVLSGINWVMAGGSAQPRARLSMRNTLVAVGAPVCGVGARRSIRCDLPRRARPRWAICRARPRLMSAHGACASTPFPRRFSRQGLCAAAALAAAGIERRRVDRRHGGQRGFRARRAQRRARLEGALGPPVPLSALPCGNISPLGVTGAPVIDEQRATLYLDAAVMRANGPRHEIFALSLADGSIEPGWPVDVATALGGNFDPTVRINAARWRCLRQGLRSVQRTLGRLRRLSRLCRRRLH